MSAEGIQQAAELLDTIFSSFDLSINVSRIETMLINSEESIESIVTLRRKKVK